MWVEIGGETLFGKIEQRFAYVEKPEAVGFVEVSFPGRVYFGAEHDEERFRYGRRAKILFSKADRWQTARVAGPVLLGGGRLHVDMELLGYVL